VAEPGEPGEEGAILKFGETEDPHPSHLKTVPTTFLPTDHQIELKTHKTLVTL